MLASPALQWARIGADLTEVQRQFSTKMAPGGRAPHHLADATEVEDVPFEAMIEREPITVICSKMGWIRAMKGHVALDQEVKFKDGDEGRFFFHAETTDKILIAQPTGGSTP